MRQRHRRIRILSARALAALVAAGAPAAHADPLGLYLGAGIGQANTKVDDFGFNEHHAGWKALVGLRPIPVIGAELEYIDFGHPSTTTPLGPVDAKVQAATLSGVLYAPLPVPVIDLYAKAGFSRLQTSATSNQVGGLFRFDRTDTRFAFGAGAQVKLSTLALRAEYQRFSSPFGDPTFLSVALTWSF